MTKTPDLLEAIVAATRTRVDSAKRREPRASLERRALARQPAGTLFAERLSRADTVNIVAECKRRSPSRGVLRVGYDPVTIARGYEQAGAAAISVLTDPGFFDGSLAHLEAVRDAVRIPLLRKDFIVDEYQLLEARATGADAILLIVSALNDGDLSSLARAAADLDLAALVEVHSVEECRRAVSAGARLIGVNNRNLRTLAVDLDVSEELIARIPHGVIAVSESGIKTSADIARFRELGFHAFLIGERFMREAEPGAALAALIASAETEDR